MPLTRVAFAEDSYSLASTFSQETLQSVDLSVRAEGVLKFNIDGEKVQEAPLKLTGKMSYDERVLLAKEQIRSVRQYRTAEAEIHIGENHQSPRLAEEHRIILAQVDENSSAMCSLNGPVARDQIELVEVQGNSLTLPGLLPEQEVKLNDSWTPQSETLAQLFTLEAVSAADVKCTLEKVETERAIVLMTGTLHGAVGGVATEIELKGRYGYDRSRRRLTSMALHWKEDRAIAHAEPGFEVTAMLRMTVSPVAAIPPLSDDALAGMPLDTDPRLSMVRTESASGNFRMLHDRRWRIFADRPELTVLRLVDRGDLLAQCNIAKLPALGEQRRMPLEKFRQDVEAALGERFGEILEIGESSNAKGLRVLKVAVSGTVSELPIRWIYYHLCDDQGHRSSLVFTLEQKLLDRFMGAEEMIVQHFEFLPQSNESPSPAAREVEAASLEGGREAARR